MALYNGTPVFLDYNSGWKPEQVDQINLIVRTARRRFEDKAKQKQEDEPLVEKIVSTRYGRALDLLNYKYDNVFSISFIFNVADMVTDGIYHILDLNESIMLQSQFGSSSDTTNPALLTSYGYFFVDEYLGNPAIYFKCEDDDFPVDSDNNRVQFSTFLGGYIL